MITRFGLLLMTFFTFQNAGAEEKEMWYGADGKAIRAVKSSELASDTWQPQWIKRELEQANPLRSRWDYRSWNRGYYGNGLYVGHSVGVPRAYYGYPYTYRYGHAGFRNYGHGNNSGYGYGYGTRGGFSGFYSHGGGHSSWGASYQRPGFQLHLRR